MMVARKDPRKSSGIFLDNDPEAFEAEFVCRMIASAAGLPRICAMKKCRRRKRCFGPYDGELPCQRSHPALCRARFASALEALGWPNINDDGTPIEGARPARRNGK